MSSVFRRLLSGELLRAVFSSVRARFHRSSESERLGDRGEREAVRYLKSAGYRIVGTNVSNAFGEVDIIARDREWLIFVEVKTRSTTSAGHPADAVDVRKQRQISRVASAWLKKHGNGGRRVRFDVVAIIWGNTAPQLQHISHAFEAPDGVD